MIKEIAFTAYRVTDMPRAQEFYEGLLKLKQAANYGGSWIEYELGEGTFVLETFSPDPPSGHRGLVAFEVDDVQATVADLKAADVPFTMEVTESPVCWTAIVTDPDGNPVAIHQRKAS
jgi:predicted enzyme related to lactoylglutathione lyase